MPSNFGATPLSTTPLGTNQFPVSAGFVPGTASGNLTSIQLGPASTDGNNYTSAPIATYTPDGNDLTQGVTTDAAVTGDVAGSISAKLRGLNKIFAQLQFDGSNFLKVNIAAGTVAATQNGTWNITNISGAVSLPTGAATSAKQPGLGTAGSASTDVLTVQGITSMTPLKVDGSGAVQPVSGTFWQATQPVSGTITANAGTGNFTVVQGTGSNLHAVLDSGSTTAVTQTTASNLNAQVVGSVASGASNAGNPVKVSGVYNSTQPTVTTGQIVDNQATARGALIVATGVDAFATNASQSGTWNITNVSGTVSLPTGAATSAKQPALGTAGSASTDVLTVQGIASMTAIKVDGSGVIQPVSGTITANAGTGTFNIQSNASVNVSQVSGSSVATAAAGIMKVGLTDGSGNALTSTTNALDVNIKSGGGSGFSVTDEAAWTAGTSAFVPAGGVFNDTATALTAGQEGTVRLTNNRAIHVNLRDASANQLLGSKTSANSIPVVVASDQGAIPASQSGTWTVQQGGSNWSTNVAQIGGTNIVTGGASGLIAVGGPVASGGSNADNPLKIGGVFNTTQPTVTNGQIVDAQYTARGAAIVATGTDTFTVTANAGTNLNTSLLALESGGNLATLAGGITSSKYQANIAQINGVAPTMGNGISGTGVQRVTIASDSTGQVTLASGANTIGAVTQASGPWTSNITQISGSSISTAAAGVQKVGVVGNSGATVDSTVGAGSAPTNAIVAGSVYNTSAPAPTNGQAMALQADQAGNMRMFPGVALATLSTWNSSTGLNATQNIFTNSGAEAVLVQLTQTTTLTAGAITFEVSYDGSTWGTIPASAVLDPTSTTFAQIALPYTVQASTNKQFLLNMNGAQGLRVKLSTQITGTGTVTPNYALLPASPADTVIALSPTAANFQVTATQSGTWASNITQVAGSSIATAATGIMKVGLTDGSGTALNSTSNALNVSVQNSTLAVTQSGTWTAVPNAATSGGSTASHTMSTASTNANSLKASTGMLYGFSISNANASARYFKLYNKASSPTVGTDTPVMTVQVPGNGTVIRAFPVGLVFGTGIAWAATGGIADSDTTAIGSNDCAIDIDYK